MAHSGFDGPVNTLAIVGMDKILEGSLGTGKLTGLQPEDTLQLGGPLDCSGD